MYINPVVKKVSRFMLGSLLGGLFGLFGVAPLIEIIITASLSKQVLEYPWAVGSVLVPLGVLSGSVYALWESRLPRRSIFRVLTHIALGATIGSLIGIPLSLRQCEVCAESHAVPLFTILWWLLGIGIGCGYSLWRWFGKWSIPRG